MGQQLDLASFPQDPAVEQNELAQELADLERRSLCARLYVRGHTQREISARLKIGLGTVNRDLQAIRSEWLESSLVDFNEAKARELAKIDHLETAAWQAWERSREDSQTLKASTTKGRTKKDGGALPDLAKTEKTVKGQTGDPRFLERIGWCIERRCAILGFDAPKKTENRFEGQMTLAGMLGLVTYAAPIPTAKPANVLDIEAEKAKLLAGDSEGILE